MLVKKYIQLKFIRILFFTIQPCFGTKKCNLDIEDLPSQFFTIKNSNFEKSYIIEKKISQGAYGTVFLAHQLPNYKEVAVKIQRTLIFDSFGVTRDVLFTSILKHENIVEIRCFDTFEPYEYSVYEYFPYTFDDFLTNNTVDFRTFILLIKQVLDALNYLRTKNIIYFDLKGNNIMITKKLQIKLIDLGISTFKESQFNIFHELNDTNNVLSDIDYQIYSPEVRSSKKFDHKADIWSLGYLFKKYFENYDLNIGDNLYFLAKNFIEKCTSKNLRIRFSADQALLHPMFNILYDFVFCFASLKDFFYNEKSIFLIKKGKKIYFRNKNYSFEIHCCCSNSKIFHSFLSSISLIRNFFYFGSKKVNSNLSKFTVMLNSEKLPLQHLTYSYYRQLIIIFEILSKKTNKI